MSTTASLQVSISGPDDDLRLVYNRDDNLLPSELAEKELAEAAILAEYLPQQLTEAEIAAIVDEEVAALTATLGDKPSMKQMGLVMKAVTPRIAGRGDGKVAAGLVRAALA